MLNVRDFILAKKFGSGSSGGGSSGGASQLDALIEGSITEVSSNAETVSEYKFTRSLSLTTARFPAAKNVEKYAFQVCVALSDIYFPELTKISSGTFQQCYALTCLDFPKATSIASYAFNQCNKVVNARFPLVQTVETNAFTNCVSLQNIDFPTITQIKGVSFIGCSSLSQVILRVETAATLSTKSAFDDTPIASGTGYIYVPSALVDTYKAATNWSTYADQFRALEDYTVDGTITGELDESKI